MYKLFLLTMVVSSCFSACSKKSALIDRTCIEQVYSPLGGSFTAKALPDVLTFGYLLLDEKVMENPGSKDTLWAKSFELYAPGRGWRTFPFEQDFYSLRECCKNRKTCILPVVIVQEDDAVPSPKELKETPLAFQEKVNELKRSKRAYLRKLVIVQRYWDADRSP